MLNPNMHLTESEIGELFSKAECVGFGNHKLQLDPAIPDQEPALDREKLAEWVALHTPKDKPIAQKIADNIRYVSFDEFYQSLINCVHKLNDEYQKSGIKDNEVIIAVPFLSQPKSNAWVTSLILRHLTFKPKLIIDALATPKLREFLADNTDIKRILIADDASYSGMDLSSILEGLKLSGPSQQIDLVVPFITHKANGKLANFCQIWSEQNMPTLDEMPFSDDEKFYLNNQNISGNEKGRIKIGKVALTYFAHKMADSDSVAEKLLKYGLTIPCRVTSKDAELVIRGLEPKPAGFERMPFIPQITPCYKQRNPTMFLSDKTKKSGLRI